MSERKKLYVLSSEEISELVRKCTQSGIDAYQRKEQDYRDATEHERTRRIKDMMASYRRVKRTIEEEKEYTPQEKNDYRLKFLEDLMGDPIKSQIGTTEQMLLDKERKREQDRFAIKQIDEAAELYQQECVQSGNEEQIRRYREFWAYYMDATAYTVEEIAEAESVSAKTVYRDLNVSCEIMYQYLVGM